MPVLKCVSEELQEVMRDFIKKKAKNETIVAYFIGSLENALPVCPGDKLLEFAQDRENSSDTDGRAPKAKKKRKPSNYNRFVGECQKNRPEGTKVTEQMKVCAAEWRGMDDVAKEKYKK